MQQGPGFQTLIRLTPSSLGLVPKAIEVVTKSKKKTKKKSTGSKHKVVAGWAACVLECMKKLFFVFFLNSNSPGFANPWIWGFHNVGPHCGGGICFCLSVMLLHPSAAIVGSQPTMVWSLFCFFFGFANPENFWWFNSFFFWISESRFLRTPLRWAPLNHPHTSGSGWSKLDSISILFWSKLNVFRISDLILWMKTYPNPSTI